MGAHVHHLLTGTRLGEQSTVIGPLYRNRNHKPEQVSTLKHYQKKHDISCGTACRIDANGASQAEAPRNQNSCSDQCGNTISEADAKTDQPRSQKTPIHGCLPRAPTESLTALIKREPTRFHRPFPHSFDISCQLPQYFPIYPGTRIEVGRCRFR